MSGLDPCVVRSRGPSGEVVLWVGVACADDYLDFLSGRCRPNTVLAAAYDLRIFLAVLGKDPTEVVPADVLAFITAQRTGRPAGVVQGLPTDGGGGGVGPATIARRVSTISGFYDLGFLRLLAGPRGRGHQPGAPGVADPPGEIPPLPGCAVDQAGPVPGALVAAVGVVLPDWPAAYADYLPDTGTDWPVINALLGSTILIAVALVSLLTGTRGPQPASK